MCEAIEPRVYLCESIPKQSFKLRIPENTGEYAKAEDCFTLKSSQ